jgi:hypothetical protein
VKKIVIELDCDDEQADKASEIFQALIKSGGLWGVKGGKTILHFDAQGIFQGVELDYWPWRRRSLNNDSTIPR